MSLSQENLKVNSLFLGAIAFQSLPPPPVVKQQIKDFASDPLGNVPELPRLTLQSKKMQSRVKCEPSNSNLCRAQLQLRREDFRRRLQAGRGLVVFVHAHFICHALFDDGQLHACW